MTEQSVNATSPSVAIVCRIGCCPGCQDCYGMSIGCHQAPCRCDLPCSCRYADEDGDPSWRDGCERHNDASDQRHRVEDFDPDLAPPLDFDEQITTDCPECGQYGACGYDQEGRAWVHVIDKDRDDA